MFRDCSECFGTGMVWVDAHSRWIDYGIAPCPVCGGEGEIEIDDDDEGEGDDDDEGEGDDDAD